MKVRIKLLDPNARIPYKTYNSDLCYDVVAVSEKEIAPNVWKYGLGIAFQIENPLKWANASIDFRPRSSVWKTGMILSNCEGTIDQGYTGEVSAVFYHVMPQFERYHIGDRIGQIKLGFTVPIDFEVVKELGETDRNNGGYGSTGR